MNERGYLLPAALTVIGFLLLITVMSTGNYRAKHLGGTQTISLPIGTKLVNVTFKDTNLWILTRQFREGDVPEAYSFQEDSAFGIFEGTILINETAPYKR